MLFLLLKNDHYVEINDTIIIVNMLLEQEKTYLNLKTMSSQKLLLKQDTTIVYLRK